MMYRLNKRAYQILVAELQNCGGQDDISRTERQIVIRRWEIMRCCQGDPATLSELRDTVVDIFPEFSQKVLKQARNANRPPGIFDTVKWVVMFVGGVTGVIWIVNLPLPMIRKPIAQKAPLLLLPSFLSMDANYKGAIAYVEQADQLVNKATSYSDIKRGEYKVRKAQSYLDNLPVWFLGYYPQAYCTMFGCSWKFTFDEFEVARQRVGRMDSKVFQEKNAFNSLNKNEKVYLEAQQQYKAASNIEEKESAIASMQSAILSLEQIPPQTVAGQNAQTILATYKPQFHGIVGQDGQGLIASTLIEAAKIFALQAAQASQNPPHSTTKWLEVEKLWLHSINRLENIKIGEPGYLEAQTLLAKYQNNVGIIRNRLQLEKESQQILQQAEAQIEGFITNPPANSKQFRAKLQGIVNKLKTVKPGTTAYGRSLELIASAQKRL